MIHSKTGSQPARRGSALISALLIVLTLGGVAVSVFGVSVVRNEEARRAGSELRAFYMAEAGLSETLMTVSVSVREDQPVPATIGSPDQPVAYRGGSFHATVRDNGDRTFDVVVHGRAGGQERAISARLAPLGGTVFDHAIFAGNRSGDPTYTLELSGVGVEADLVLGDVYSGNDVELREDASVTGDIVASGTIVGATGDEGPTRPIPDIAGMAYAANPDVDVAQAFDALGLWTASPLGGSAFQVPVTDPAHIFRKNPDDRADELASTVKDDYFLEDPYEPVKNYTATYGSNGEGHTVTLSGIDGQPGPNGNDVVYFIDGNLWVHNKPWGRMRFNRGADPTRVTFIVRGNVYFSDDVTVMDGDTDALAFIAIDDPNEPDSGNIYLGDPRYGTVERVEAYLYAENDFVDVNLDESGSKEVTLIGNMTAGDHVRIQRDFVNPDGTTTHSKLTVDFDDRLSRGTVELPGIPTTRDNGVDGYGVVLWREVAE